MYISFFILIIFSLFSAIVTMIARQINSKSLKKLDFWMVKKFSKPTEDFRGASSQVLQRLLREIARWWKCPPPPRARHERKKLIIVIIPGANKWSSTGSGTNVISQIGLHHIKFTWKLPVQYVLQGVYSVKSKKWCNSMMFILSDTL